MFRTGDSQVRSLTRELLETSEIQAGIDDEIARLAAEFFEAYRPALEALATSA